MGAVYRRKGSRYVWLKWFDAHGLEQRRSSGTESEDDAQALLEEIERQEREKAPRVVLGALTVERWFDEVWLPLRQRTRPWQWKSDLAGMRTHFLPKFGGHALAGLATDAGEVELLKWLEGLREHRSRRDGTPLASRTQRNVASVVRMFFADARQRKVIARNPTVDWARNLPAIEDKERGWRAQAGFTLEQVVTLTTDERIPEDRRVLYTLRFLGGLRPGEAANARWRELNRSKRPLWRLGLESSFNSPMQREKGTKTGAELNIPVHPVLQEALERWDANGWEEFMGRKSEPSDFIFPRGDGQQRRVSATYKQFKADLATVGLPVQRQYESRSTFRNLALSAGAIEFHLNLITHPTPKRASDHYTRLEMQWPGMCAAVLAIDRAAWTRTPQDAPNTQVTVRVTDQGTTNDKPPTILTIVGGELEREKGFEPSTLALARRCSTAELFPQILERGASL